MKCSLEINRIECIEVEGEGEDFGERNEESDDEKGEREEPDEDSFYPRRHKDTENIYFL